MSVVKNNYPARQSVYWTLYQLLGTGILFPNVCVLSLYNSFVHPLTTAVVNFLVKMFIKYIDQFFYEQI